MTLDEKIAYEEKKSEVRPKSCKGCRHVFTEEGKYGNHFCKLIHGSYEEECINYCVANDITAYNCPLLTEDKAKNHRQLAEWLKELKAYREKDGKEDQALKNLEHALEHGRVKTSLGPPDPKYFYTKLIVTGYSSHDCETHYKCPFCGEPYRSWSIKTNEVFTCKCGKKVWTD